MAARRAERRKTERDREVERARQELAAQREDYILDYMDRLLSRPLSEVRAEHEYSKANPIGCACIGGPVCCQIRYQAAERVLND